MYTSGGSCGCACIIPPKSRGHLPPVGQRCLPAVLWVVYLRSSVLAGRCLPAVLTSTCGAFGCLPPVVSPTLGGSKFEYTSGGCCTELGKTLAIWKTTCGAIASTAGVGLSIPPVAPADVPALYRPLIGTSTCGAKNILYRARYRPLANSERKAQGRKGHTKTSEVHGANGD